MTDFNGWTPNDFQAFHIKGLDERMEAIRERIQPKFQAVGETLADDVASKAGDEMFLHIAKHARRTKNPPDSTWMALCHDKRGYKKHPHFQVGLFDDHLFIWLALINEFSRKKEVGQALLEQKEDIVKTIPGDYMISPDHTKNEASALKDTDLQKALERFRDVKKGEFLIGRRIASDDPILQDGDVFLQTARQTLETLIPLYRHTLS